MLDDRRNEVPSPHARNINLEIGATALSIGPKPQLYLLGFYLAAGAGAIGVPLYHGKEILAAIAFLIFVIVGLVCAYVLMFKRRPIIDLSKPRGVCAACHAHLGEEQPEPDGCTVCPKCGAAWRLPEPTKTSS